MSEFTKGEWYVKRHKSGNIESASVFYPHGFLTSANVIKVDESRSECESWLDMRSRTEGQRRANELESIANMHLISAAPDMYAALMDARSALRYIRETHGDLYGVGFDRVEENSTLALNKAEGKG